MTRILKLIIPNRFHKKVLLIKNIFFDGYSIKSYSQEGEDMILRRIFENQRIGFYVDVGAHHPKRFSNTYFFYKKNWNGINIDAMPGSMKLFKKYRKRDINLEVPISDKEQNLKYYVFEEPALNSFSSSLSESRMKNNIKLLYIQKLSTKKLSNVLDNYIENNQEIDFLSVDVEGLDFSVLNSNDWEKYRPKVVIVETLKNSIENIFENEIYLFMRNNGYILYAKSVNTSFFLEQNFYNYRFPSFIH